MRKYPIVLLLAGAVAGLLPARAGAMLAPTERSTDIKNIRTALESKVLRERLSKFGLTPQEIDSRLERLSDPQVHQLAKNIESLNSGGRERIFNGSRDHEILVVVLIVLLIVLII